MDPNEEPRLLGSPDVRGTMSIALGDLFVIQRPVDALRSCFGLVFKAAM